MPGLSGSAGTLATMPVGDLLRLYGSIPSDQLDDWIGGLSPADFDALTSAIAQLPRNQGQETEGASYAGAVARGLGQTLANGVNDLQDGVVGVMNLPFMAMNGSFWLQEQLGIFEDAGRLPYYQLPEWSKDLLVHEALLARDINKAVSGAVLGASIAKATNFLKPVVTKVDDAAGAAGSSTRSATGVSRPGSVSGNPANRLVETGTPLKDGYGWRKRWYRMTEDDYNAYRRAIFNKHQELEGITKNWDRLGVESHTFRFEEMAKFRNQWLQDFLERRDY